MKMEAPIHFFPLGSGVDVPLKCHWSANRQQPTATAIDLPLLTPPLSTVGWSKTTSFNHLGKEVDPPEVSVSRRHGHIHTDGRVFCCKWAWFSLNRHKVAMSVFLCVCLSMTVQNTLARRSSRPLVKGLNAYSGVLWHIFSQWFFGNIFK